MSRSKKLRLFTLCLVLFIDTLGGALIAPLISPLFFQSHGLITHLVVPMREILFGVSSGIFFIMAFFGAPLLGSLSDHYGRKRLLSICVLGSVVGYGLSISAIYIHSISLFIIGRIVDGFTAGSLGLAQAAVTDISTKEEKAKSIGYVFLSLSLGFLVGPLFSGLLAIFGTAIPFYVVIVLALFNVSLLWLFFDETRMVTAKPSFNLFSTLCDAVKIIGEPPVNFLFLTFTLMQLGWSFYIQDVALYMTQKFHLTTLQLSSFLFIISVGFAFATGVVLPRLRNLVKLKPIIMMGLIILFCLMVLMTVFEFEMVSWLVAIPLAISLAITYSSLNAMISNAVSEDQQGMIMGNIGGVSALTFGIGGLCAGLLSPILLSLPLILAMISFLIAIIIFYRCYPLKDHDFD